MFRSSLQRLRPFALPLFAASAASLLLTNSSWNSPTSPSFGDMTPKEFKPLRVKQIVPVTANSKLIKLDLGGEGDELPVSSFVLTKCKGPDGKDVSRPYTPLANDDPQHGELTLLVKKYDGGVMSSYLASLHVGDDVEVKGPLTKMSYEPNQFDHIAMIAGGTGITPMIQILSKALENPNDKTKFTLLFGNQSPEDILLKEELDAMQREFPSRLHVVYTVDRVGANSKWKGKVGLITKDLIDQTLPKPSPNTFAYVCGPLPMYKAISGTKAPDYSQGELDGALKELGWTKERVFKL